MAKLKSFVKTIAIDHALKSHNCQHSNAHRLAKGDIRLSLKTQRSYEYYCGSCAIASLEADICKLNEFLSALRHNR